MNNELNKGEHGTKSHASHDYRNTRLRLAEELRKCPIPDSELTGNLALYIERMHLSRILLMHQLYQQILVIPGVIMELGVRWGQNMALFSAFRGMYEPYNYTRRIIGFDTFDGFPQIASEDNPSKKVEQANVVGDYSVTPGWKENLEAILHHHEQTSPLAHITKWELVEGDASLTFQAYLDCHPELVVALAYFDFDIFLPTKHCLERLLPRLTKGSIVVFDELNCPDFPGETVALREVIGTHNVALRRDPNNPYVSWFIWQ